MYYDIIERVVSVREKKRRCMLKLGVKCLNKELLVALSNKLKLLQSCFYLKLINIIFINTSC